MQQVKIHGRSFNTPILVPSASSFETQIPPADALALQQALGEPISLVSAYDLRGSNSDLIAECQRFRERSILLLDSGGYETSRIKKYAPSIELDWSFDRFREIAEIDCYDFVFSFDYIPMADETAEQYTSRLIKGLHAHVQFISEDKLIPVLHVVGRGRAPFTPAEILQLVRTIARSFRCRFIAIPERELGDGIVTRAKRVKEMVRVIKDQASETDLHLLGCGNLLSFSFFAVAGAMMCDGLEWCRTSTAENFHLHHFQQKDLFARAAGRVPNDAAELLLRQQVSYDLHVAIRNLVAFQAFTNMLHERMQTGSVAQMVEENFGPQAGAALHKLAS